MERLKLGDWPLFILAADAGPVRRLDEVMADYRIHPGGIWTAKPAVQKHRAVVEMLEALERHFGARYVREVATLLACYHRELALALDQAGEPPAAVAEHLGRAVAAGIRAAALGTTGMTIADGLTAAVAAVVGRYTREYANWDLARLRSELAATRAELAETRTALDAIRTSKTWRLAMALNAVVTRPVAWLMRRFRRQSSAGRA